MTFDETVPTQFESYGLARPWASNEVILGNSERSNWGHLPLRSKTGRLKKLITSGDGPVMQIARIDERRARLARRERPTHIRIRTSISQNRAQHGGAAVALTPDDGTRHPVCRRAPASVDIYSKPDALPVVTLRDSAGKLILPLERRYRELLATGCRRPPIKMTAHDGRRHLRPTVPPDEFRCVGELNDRQQRLSGPADRQHRQPCVQRGARRPPGARRARLRRRHDRRHGHARPIEGVPGRLLRRDGPRQYHPRSDRRHDGAGAPLSVDRPRPRRHLGPFGRRVRCHDGDVPVPRLLQSWDRRVWEPRSA